MPATFEEVADRVWVARHEWLDVNLTAIAGQEGLVLVDTLGSAKQMGAALEAVRALGAGDVVAAVNTHEHFDHTFGNSSLGGVPIHAHETAAANTVPAGERAKLAHADDLDEPHAREVTDTTIIAATETFSSARVIDLGDRQVELVHPGRGHTAGDIVVRVPDANVLLAGDLVEESAPPAFGEDSWPMEWPSSLDLAISLMDASTAVVPGHGAVVDLDFVHEQRGNIGIVAETVRDLAGRGVPVGLALEQGEWPWPEAVVAQAVRRGYEQLPRAAKHLPLI